MNAMRLAVGILFVVLASKTCTLAMAQDARPTAIYGAAITKSQDDGLDGCCRPSWNDPCPSVYGQVEALFLMREPRFTHQPIVVDPNTSTTFLSTSDLDFNFDPGLRATVGMRLCGGRALEFSYFGLCARRRVRGCRRTDACVPTFPGNLAGNVFPWMDRVRVNYSSWVHSFELNLLCCCGCCDECDSGKGGDKGDSGKGGDACGCGEVRCRSFEWFAGFRYLNLGEELNISAQGVVPGGTKAPTTFAPPITFTVRSSGRGCDARGVGSAGRRLARPASSATMRNRRNR